MWINPEPTAQIGEPEVVQVFSSQCIPGIFPITPECHVDPISAISQLLKPSNAAGLLQLDTDEGPLNGSVTVLPRVTPLHKLCICFSVGWRLVFSTPQNGLGLC